MISLQSVMSRLDVAPGLDQLIDVLHWVEPPDVGQEAWAASVGCHTLGTSIPIGTSAIGARKPALRMASTSAPDVA